DKPPVRQSAQPPVSQPAKPPASQPAKPPVSQSAKPPPSAPASHAPPRTRDAAPPTVNVLIESVPSGAQVVVGGSVLGKTPYHGTWPRRTGDAALVVRLAGYADRTITLHTDQAISERIKLVKAAPRGRDQSMNPFAE